MTRLPNRSIGALAVLAWLFAAPGSAIAEPGTPVPATDAAVAALLANSAQVMTAVSTFQFVLTYERGKTTLYGRIKMQRAKGSVARPDRLEATVAARLGLVKVDVKVIGVGGRVWVQLAGVD